MIPELEKDDNFVQVDIPVVVSITVPKDDQYDMESYFKALKTTIEESIGWEEDKAFRDVDAMKVTAMHQVAVDLNADLLLLSSKPQGEVHKKPEKEPEHGGFFGGGAGLI